MFTFDKWLASKWAKEAKGKQVSKIVLMPSFWNHVVYILKDRCKETIKKSFNENEDKYKEIFSIIDKRWECQLHRPLHATDRLVSDIDVQDKIIRELSTYKNAKGLFDIPIAIRSKKTLAPINRIAVRKPSPPATFLATLSGEVLFHTDHTIRCARRSSSSFVKAPEGDSQSRTGSGGLNLTRQRVRVRGTLSDNALPPPTSPDAV
ncbi:hypothetical protein CK203_084709 [Vitis vinifera]|uniref:Uncharacterized protein n=1 Tax=Vitis vinifera TaxID=29760 RepID=A0A438EU70_VITVI|nr:hypothetical protein CK203_084709 [Vitis vinifera]